MMISTYLKDKRYFANKQLNHTSLIDNLLKSRNLFNIHSVEYDLITVTSLDIDESNNFMLVGLSNGSIDLKEIEDPTYGNLSQLARFDFGQHNINRVQWSPCGSEQFFSLLDNHILQLVDPVEMRVLDKYDFNLKTNWSEWNPNDRKMIAVCGSESQVRLADIRSGSSVQTIILGAPSRLATHRATRCLWSKQDLHCLIVGDNEGYLHVYDTRHSTRPLVLAGGEQGQISGMSFTGDQSSLITSQGTENHIVQWNYSNCTLKPLPHKFRKHKKPPDNVTMDVESNPQLQKNKLRSVAGPSCDTSASRTSRSNPSSGKQKETSTRKRRFTPIPVDAYIRCQFHVNDRHLYCPAPSSATKSKELYIYDIESGARIKTLKSDGILSKGVYSVSSLLPDSLVIYVGGRSRLKVWTIDEGFQRKLEEKIRIYHRTQWDSDEEA